MAVGTPLLFRDGLVRAASESVWVLPSDNAWAYSEAVTALQSLGYDRKEAEEAVRRAQKNLPSGAELEEIIKRSLAHV